jgi:AbrB family looped-hinge helix DNA binding protein
MAIVTVSSKYQIVIPRDVRNALGIKAGMRLQALGFAGRIELIPVRPIKTYRGFLKGIDSRVPREPDRE